MAVYDAFISYSHAKDKAIAAALQSVIQKLGKPWYQRRALRVFRDDTSLSATPSLWPSIEQALAGSRFLVLLASPEAAGSQWVNKEVAYWLEHKSADTLLIALTDGDLDWDNTVGDFARRERMPLPPALAGRFSTEPKWVDLTAYRDGADPREAKFAEAAADFAAAIQGIAKEDLLSQELRQQRRALRLAWSAAGSLLLLAGIAGWQAKVAIEQRDHAERNFGIAKQGADHVVFRLAEDLRDVEGMRVESLRRILDAAQAMMDQLAKAAPDDLKLQRSRSAMLNQFAITYRVAGDLARAIAAAEESLAVMRRLVAIDPGNTGWRRDLSISLDQVGDAQAAAGSAAAALTSYEESLAISRALIAAEPGRTEWQNDVARGLTSIGDVRFKIGDRTRALAAYDEALAIRRRLAVAEPSKAQWQRLVSVSLARIGNVRLDTGDGTGALEFYEESLAINRKLAASDPGNAEWQRDVAVGLVNVGQVRLALGDRRGALAAYEESLAIRRKLAVVDPGHTGWQRDVQSTLNRVGDARLATTGRARWPPTRRPCRSFVGWQPSIREMRIGSGISA